MRISTFQFYQLNTNNILDKQSKVNDTIIHLSEGKRVITAGDDSVAANSILNFKQEVRVTEQYQRNITFASSRLENEETALVTAENLMDRIKELALTGNTGALGAEAREAIAQELENRLEELMSVANTRDEAGNYIFAGFQTNRPPFAEQPDGSVIYYGDEGVRQTTVGANVNVATNDAGVDVFMDIPNSTGDFRASYGGINTAGTTVENTGRTFVESATITDPANYDPTAATGMPPDYKVEFVDLDADGQVEYQIFDSTGTQVEPAAGSTPFATGQTIGFNGLEIVMTGEPDAGDLITLTPQESKDVFTSVREAIDWMRQGRATDDEKDRLQVAMGHIIADLDQATNHITSTRANIGSRMQVVDSQNSINQDYLVTIETARINLEELDIAEASTDYSRQTIALQAAQQAFSKVQSLTLFNLI